MRSVVALLEASPLGTGIALVLVIVGGTVGARLLLGRPASGRPVPPLPDPDDDDGVSFIAAIMCGPCNGEPRRSDRTSRCSCAGHCGSPACSGGWVGDGLGDGLGDALRRITEGHHG